MTIPIIYINVTGSAGPVVIPEILTPSINVQPTLITSGSVVQVAVTTAPGVIRVTPVVSPIGTLLLDIDSNGDLVLL